MEVADFNKIGKEEMVALNRKISRSFVASSFSWSKAKTTPSWVAKPRIIARKHGMRLLAIVGFRVAKQG